MSISGKTAIAGIGQTEIPDTGPKTGFTIKILESKPSGQIGTPYCVLKIKLITYECCIVAVIQTKSRGGIDRRLKRGKRSLAAMGDVSFFHPQDQASSPSSAGAPMPASRSVLSRVSP